MKKIYTGDALVRKVIGTKNSVANGEYRWSCYVVPYEYEGVTYLFNNFTKVIYQLDDESFDMSSEKRFSSEELSADESLAQLVYDLFIVPVGKDETAAYEGYCRIARAIKMKRNGYNGFTILPTTACNARCIYCYEQGIEYVTMKDDTVEQVVEFIKKVRDPSRSVFFSWFGGEPLIGEKYIDKICASLRAEGIEYKSRMTTNGSLITRDIVKKMREDWNLQRMQITLDGIEEEYNRRKNYYFNYESAYWHVLSRIKMINESGISLNIRVNVDMGNIDGVPQMVEDLSDFIVDRSIVTIDLAPLFDLQASKSGIEIWKKSFEIADVIRDKGFRAPSPYSISKTRYRFCMADSPYGSIVIAPDGKLYNCENIMSFDTVGDIWNGITNHDYLRKLNEVEPAREMCRGCFSLPDCTTFSRCGHPRVDCKFAARRRLERALSYKLPLILAKQAETEEPDDETETENNNENC